MIVAKLYKQLDPPPAVPEAAREPFVMGATVLKKATDPAGANRAADLFTDSLNIAPWFAEAYYNRALAREAGGQFDVAIFNLKVYLEYNLTEAERREAQDKVYSLKADAQLAATKQAEERKAAAAKAAEKEKAAAITKAHGKSSIEGAWFSIADSIAPGYTFPTPAFIITRRGSSIEVKLPGKSAKGVQMVATNIEATETTLRFSYEYYAGTLVTYDLHRDGELLVGQTRANNGNLSTERLIRKPWAGEQQ